MIKKVKKNALLIAILATLLGIGAKNSVSAANVATVIHTKYEIHLVMGGITRTSYSWMNLYYHTGFRVSNVERINRYEGINPAFLYVYHYKIY
ncbi:hypothetical protein [Streptococcus sanguinis]|uniref:hypothetical protein n=1 Tax=Streptococcus sanguinis TaxID=1305 RepID=UPI001CBAF700|nr:hypothetical protein [Streptococcus sanguinis]MBZ2020944.1 hypothetical protein [Streptococcus sanguinis]MBZ2073293.1 hypothetical protein [Streptococcus sanguinis]MBZ2081988.1 hypothetical protein [Streptococcus sanguinis]MCC3166840.1 hypothetical protein [Streptococcus sanguinis]